MDNTGTFLIWYDTSYNTPVGPVGYRVDFSETYRQTLNSPAPLIRTAR